MGLYTSHDAWGGAYSSFKQFRELVGRAAGLPYRVIDRPGNYDHGEFTVDIDWDLYEDENLYGRWRKKRPVWQRQGDIYGAPKQDDVLYLIVHSDCEGQLRNGYLPRLKARLEELEPRYDELAASNPYAAGSLRRFIEGLDRAIGDGEHITFS